MQTQMYQFNGKLNLIDINKNTYIYIYIHAFLHQLISACIQLLYVY